MYPENPFVRCQGKVYWNSEDFRKCKIEGVVIDKEVED